MEDRPPGDPRVSKRRAGTHNHRPVIMGPPSRTRWLVSPKRAVALVSRAQRSTKWCAADPGPLRSVAVPDQRCTASLRYALHRVRDTQCPRPHSSPLFTFQTAHLAYRSIASQRGQVQMRFAVEIFSGKAPRIRFTRSGLRSAKSLTAGGRESWRQVSSAGAA